MVSATSQPEAAAIGLRTLLAVVYLPDMELHLSDALTNAHARGSHPKRQAHKAWFMEPKLQATHVAGLALAARIAGLSARIDAQSSGCRQACQQ